MNIASVTQQVRTEIEGLIRRTVAQITTAVVQDVLADIGRSTAQSTEPVKRAARAARPAPKAPRAPARAAKGEKKARAAAEPKPAKAPKSTEKKGGGTRYGLNPEEVLAKLRFAGDAGAKAETIRKDFFADVPAPVFTRALKKLIAAKLVKVVGERRAATYFVTAKGAKGTPIAAMAGSGDPLPQTPGTEVEVPAAEAAEPEVTNGASDEPVSTRLLQDNTHEDAVS